MIDEQTGEEVLAVHYADGNPFSHTACGIKVPRSTKEKFWGGLAIRLFGHVLPRETVCGECVAARQQEGLGTRLPKCVACDGSGWVPRTMENCKVCDGTGQQEGLG